MTQSHQGYIKNPIYLSYTALSDFIKCPRAYYLKNLYRTEDGLRMQIASPYLTLGATVHDSLKWYLQQPQKPSEKEVIDKFRNFWRKFRLNRGGFSSIEEEAVFGQRGLKMVRNFLKNVACLEPCAPFIEFPKIILVENVVLNGNFDFVGECSDGSLHIIDFKTGAYDQEDAIQLYIYAILAEDAFGKRVSKISFWYLDREDLPREVVLDPLPPKVEWLKEKGLKMKQAIEEKKWICVKSPQTCRDCTDYQLVLDGKAKFLFDDGIYHKKIFFLDRKS